MTCRLRHALAAFATSLLADLASALAPARQRLSTSAVNVAPDGGQDGTRLHFGGGVPRTGPTLSHVWLQTGSGAWSEEKWSNSIRDCYTVEPWENYSLLWPVHSDYVQVVTFQSEHYVDNINLRNRVQDTVTWPLPYKGEQGCSETMGKSPDEYDAAVDWTSSTRHCFTWVALREQMRAWLKEARAAGVNVTQADILEALGLRPDWSKDTVVELTVRREDLLRMCYDREPDDDRCASSKVDGTSASWAQFMEDVSALQLALGEESSNSIGGGATPSGDAVPFTHMGYAYNSAHARALSEITGHERSQTETAVVGFSEFVIRPGSAVHVGKISRSSTFLDGLMDS